MSYVLRQVRKHPEVAPVFFITGLGAVFATAAIIRTLMVYPDVSIRRSSNPHPFLNVKPDEHVKFFRFVSYKGLKNERPNYEEDKD